MAITATMVNELRQKAGVGLMDCKKALVATNGDMDAAMEYLRKAGIAKADKKAGRSASEGVVETLIEGKTGVAVEILCETDFVARTDAFKDFCKYVARTAMAMDGDGDISEKLAAATEEEMKVLIGKLGENMHVRRAVRWTTNGIIKEYKHHQGGTFPKPSSRRNAKSPPLCPNCRASLRRSSKASSAAKSTNSSRPRA